MRPTSFAVLSLLTCAAHGETVSAQPQVADGDTPGFSLPIFQSGYPGETFVYEDAEARQLAQEVLPVGASKVTRAVVRTTQILPPGSYFGVSIDLAFEVRTARSSICEEPHVFLTFSYDRRVPVSSEMRLSVSGGKIAGHAFEDIRAAGRYISLSEAPASNEAVLEACRSLAVDTSNWRRADTVDEFVSEEGRQRALVEAVRTLPLGSISCTAIDGTSCKHGRNELLALIRDTPPDHSQGIFVPEEGSLYVYSYREPDVQVGEDYTVILHTAFRDKPATIDIRFKRNARPVI